MPGLLTVWRVEGSGLHRELGPAAADQDGAVCDGGVGEARDFPILLLHAPFDGFVDIGVDVFALSLDLILSTIWHGRNNMVMSLGNSLILLVALIFPPMNSLVFLCNRKTPGKRL